MFTGLIECTGTIRGRRLSGKSGRLVVELARPLEGLRNGESISVNGACLTLEKSSKGRILQFHVLAETFSRTNLGRLPLKSEVNIERALSPSARIGGHFVTGHIDAAVPVKSLRRRGSDWVLSVNFPAELAKFIVEKGSVAIDGISLTVAELEGNLLSVHMIPETVSRTCILRRKKGQPVNLETDLIGKHVCRCVETAGAVSERKKSRISLEMLDKAGWV